MYILDDMVYIIGEVLCLGHKWITNLTKGFLENGSYILYAYKCSAVVVGLTLAELCHIRNMEL
jgi:hypothetical protein